MESTNIAGGTQTPQPSSSTVLTDHQKATLRQALVDQARKLLGVPYDLGAEWVDYTKPPEALDCSELVEGCYKIVGLRMEDGSQNQFNFTVPQAAPLPGDLAFFGKGKDITKIYHVGMVLSETGIIEARGFQPGSSFDTGRVIIRPRAAWEMYQHFVGYRSHPKLA